MAQLLGSIREHHPNGFKARVIGKVRAGLPRKPPGRRGSPEIQKAAEIYIRDYKLRDKKGNWREIGKLQRKYPTKETDATAVHPGFPSPVGAVVNRVGWVKSCRRLDAAKDCSQMA